MSKSKSRQESRKRKRPQEEELQQEEQQHQQEKKNSIEDQEEGMEKGVRKKNKKKKKEKEKNKEKQREKQASEQEQGEQEEQPKQKKKKKKSKKQSDQDEPNNKEDHSSEKKSKKKKHTKQVQQQPQQQVVQKQQEYPKKKSKKKKHQHQQAKPDQVKHQQDLQAEQSKPKKANKPLSKPKQAQPKKKPEKVESINVINRQLAKQCVTKKSNFYLQKQQKLKQGLPVGRGSKRAQQKMEQQRRRILTQRNKKKKNLKKQESDLTVKEQDEAPQSKSTAASKTTTIKKKKDDCTKEQSIRIINLFSVDAGDYRGMVKELADIPLAKIRGHLRMLFQRSLEIITKRVQESGRKINDWQLMEKREIIRELHRIRCTNRLLSEQNVDFRDKFLKLMMNYNDPSLALTDTDYNYMYRKIQAFVRGFCSLGTSKKKNEVKFEDTLEENRQPLLEGGYIMDRNRVKRQVKMEQKLQEAQPKKIDPEKIMLEWTEEEEKELGQLYISQQANAQAIHEQLKIKFGLKSKWKDFQLLNRKIDCLVKLGLNKLQELTLKPYKREEKMRQEQQKKKIPVKQTDPTDRTEISSLDLMTKFIYNNKRVVVSKSEETLEGGLFKNLPLLERQIFGHVESIQSRFALVKLLSEKFPPEQHVEQAIRVIKQFVAYAVEWEKKNRILLLRQEPVLEQEVDIPALATRLVGNTKSSSDQSQEEEDQDKFQGLAKQMEESRARKGGKQFDGTNDEFQFLSDDENIQELMNETLRE